jgi:hypothetical protein
MTGARGGQYKRICVGVSGRCSLPQQVSNSQRHFERRRRRLSLEAVIGAARNPLASLLFEGISHPARSCCVTGAAEAGVRNDEGVISRQGISHPARSWFMSGAAEAGFQMTGA